MSKNKYLEKKVNKNGKLNTIENFNKKIEQVILLLKIRKIYYQTI